MFADFVLLGDRLERARGDLEAQLREAQEAAAAASAKVVRLQRTLDEVKRKEILKTRHEMMELEAEDVESEATDAEGEAVVDDGTWIDGFLESLTGTAA